MINITLIVKDNILIGFETKGHAYYADEGSDIVCAGASTLTQIALKSLVEFGGLVEEDIVYSVNKGNISVEIKDKARANSDVVQTIFKFLELGIKEIENNYSDYINLKYRGCSNV